MSARRVTSAAAFALASSAGASAHAQGAPRPGPSIEHGVATKVGGELTAAAIERAVDQRRGAFLACYQRGLRANAALHGELVLRFVIAPSGAISNLQSPGATLGDRSVVRCVVQAFSRVRFARAGREAITVIYAIEFEPHARFGL